MKKKKIGLVGAGAMGMRHLQHLQQGSHCEVVGVADPAGATNQRLIDSGVPVFGSLGDLVAACEVDGVLIASPNQTHEVVALDCISRGLPALIEKPIAADLDAARRIVEKSELAGVPILVGHHRRHNPVIATAKTFIDEGGLGDIIAVNSMELRRKPDSWFNADWKTQPGGGPILINTIHDVDTIRWLCGDIDLVSAFISNHARGNRVEDTASISMRLQSGALASFILSDAVQAPWAWGISSREDVTYPAVDENVIVIGGTKGSLTIPTLTFWRHEGSGGRGDPFLCKRLFCIPSDPWVEQLKHFSRVIDGAEPPLVSARDGYSTLASTLAILESARTALPVAPQAFDAVAT